MNAEKKTVLFLTHLYPRHESDFMAPFLGTLIENLTPYFNMVVLCPRHGGNEKERNGVKLEYFKYCFKSLEKYSYTGNLYARLRKINIFNQVLAVFFMCGFLIKGMELVGKYKPSIIHCSWFVPAGIVGYILSLLYRVPLVCTVFSDAFLIEKSKILKFMAKVIFNQARVVIAISNSVKQYVIPVSNNIKVIYPCNRVF